jgi:hypothetical protein
MLAEETKTTFDPYASASNPPERTYDLFGLVEVNAWACHLEKGQGKVAYDPANPNHKRVTAVDIYIQPLPEINVKYASICEEHWVAEFPTWAGVTLPSIKKAMPDFGSLRDLQGKWARVTRVAGRDKPYERKDAQGNGTGEMVTKKTMSFVEFYNSEEECRAAAIAANAFDPGKVQVQGNGHNVPTTEPVLSLEEQEKKTAAQFLAALVPNAARGKTPEQARIDVAMMLTQYAPVAKYFTVDSPEVVALINSTLA